MSKVMLPYVEPMYSTYHRLSCAGIPAKQNITSDIWYYNNTVEWYCTRKFLQGFTTPEINLESGGIWEISFLEKSGVDARFARRCATDVIKAMIDEGFYVAFSGVDDYYVKGKSWYKEQHFNHDGLITGYDDENGTLSIAAYDQRWVFTVFETPQESFIEAMTFFCDKGVYGGLYAVKAKDEAQELDVQRIYKDLKTYLSSGIDEYVLDSPDAACGIVVYDYICMYLDKLTDGSIPYERSDRRVFRLIWEHKKCMLERIKAVEKQYGWDDSLSKKYEEVVNLSDKARFIYAKFVIKYSNTALEKIQVILIKIKKLELDLLAEFLLKIEVEMNDGE